MGPRPPPPGPPTPGHSPPPPHSPGGRWGVYWKCQGGGGFFQERGGVCTEIFGGGEGRRGRRAPFTAKTSSFFGENAFFCDSETLFPRCWGFDACTERTWVHQSRATLCAVAAAIFTAPPHVIFKAPRCAISLWSKFARRFFLRFKRTKLIPAAEFPTIPESCGENR